MDKLRQLIMGAGGWRRLRDFAFLVRFQQSLNYLITDLQRAFRFELEFE